MKLLDVAGKDMRQSFRSLTGIMFMFVVPILVTGLFAFLFGGVAAGDDFAVPRTTLVLVDQDAGQLPADAGRQLAEAGAALAGVTSMGQLLVGILQQDAFATLLDVSVGASAAAAREAVDAQRADVALVVPPNFTDALMLPGVSATIELYHDPTLTLGPAIVASLIDQFADRFAATKIGASVVLQGLAESGVTVDEELAQSVVAAVAAAALTEGESESPSGVVVESPPGATPDDNLLATILGQIMGGMMIFFAFFTGAGTLQTILVEEERGTLARLFTTPTPIPVILGGKVLGTIVTLAVQVSVLLLFGRLVFGIRWGAPGAVALAAAGIVLTSAATGLLLAALLRSTRQSGAVYGGALTLTGMIGMISIFVGGQVTPTIQAITLLVPQGWAVRGLQTAMAGGGPADLLPALAGQAAWIAVFSAVALHRLSRRFA